MENSSLVFCSCCCADEWSDEKEENENSQSAPVAPLFHIEWIPVRKAFAPSSNYRYTFASVSSQHLIFILHSKNSLRETKKSFKRVEKRYFLCFHADFTVLGWGKSYKYWLVPWLLYYSLSLLPLLISLAKYFQLNFETKKKAFDDKFFNFSLTTTKKNFLFRWKRERGKKHWRWSTWLAARS